MAQQQQNVTIAAPGFMGVNTEDSPLGLPESFAAIADNCVIDRFGRIGSRKGYSILTGDNTALGTEDMTTIHEFIAKDGTKIVFSAGNNLIFSGTTTLTDITGAATITADDWQVATLNDDCFFFQRGHAPLVYRHSTSTLTAVTAHANYAATVQQGNAVLSAYGRLWVADTTADKSTVWWSDLVIGPAWSGGSSGSIDITEYWPNGQDDIVGLAAHNNKLIIFGTESIIIYGSSASDGHIGTPASDLMLDDVIKGIGCVSRHTIQSVGSDLLFVDTSGVRSLGRTIQEKSLPIGDISRNVRRNIKADIDLETFPIRGLYSSDEAWYIVVLPSLPHTYCFDMRGLLEDGSARTTMWTGLGINAIAKLQDGTVYFGSNDGVLSYTGSLDGTAYYMMRFYSNPLTFGSPSTLKFPKQIDYTIINGSLQKATAYWAYNYTNQFKREVFTLNAHTPDFYNVDEYNITTADDPDDPTEYIGGSSIGRYKVNPGGDGEALTVGLEVKINGNATSIQEINIQALIGRIT